MELATVRFVNFFSVLNILINCACLELFTCYSKRSFTAPRSLANFEDSHWSAFPLSKPSISWAVDGQPGYLRPQIYCGGRTCMKSLFSLLSEGPTHSSQNSESDSRTAPELHVSVRVVFRWSTIFLQEWSKVGFYLWLIEWLLIFRQLNLGKIFTTILPQLVIYLEWIGKMKK